MHINCYMERSENAPLSYRMQHAPNATKIVGGVTYLRFGEGSQSAVHRLSVAENGLVEHKWTLGSWEMAETLDYDKEINETVEVPNENHSL